MPSAQPKGPLLPGAVHGRVERSHALEADKPRDSAQLAEVRRGAPHRGPTPTSRPRTALDPHTSSPAPAQGSPDGSVPCGRAPRQDRAGLDRGTVHCSAAIPSSSLLRPPCRVHVQTPPRAPGPWARRSRGAAAHEARPSRKPLPLRRRRRTPRSAPGLGRRFLPSASSCCTSRRPRPTFIIAAERNPLRPQPPTPPGAHSGNCGNILSSVTDLRPLCGL